MLSLVLKYFINDGYIPTQNEEICVTFGFL
jgi:hypothetical protein